MNHLDAFWEDFYTWGRYSFRLILIVVFSPLSLCCIFLLALVGLSAAPDAEHFRKKMSELTRTFLIP